MASNNRQQLVFYDNEQEQIVMSPLETITTILKGTDMAEKERVLFSLDKYLDPYYGYHLS